MNSTQPAGGFDRTLSATDLGRSGVASADLSDSSRLVNFRKGDPIGNKYVFEGLLGEGGMAYVLAARHTELDERVAVKLLRPEAVNHPEIVARFAREARASVRIKSEHVVRVFDVGTLEDGTPFMVMEYLDGGDLRVSLRARRQLPVAEAVEYTLQACEALAVAHMKGIVHRDIKPENLFITTRADGTNILKVLDFGISKVALTGSAFGVDLELVQTMTLMGSPLYMSPEQLRATQNVDARSDLWSLGVVLYEMLAGKSPFDGKTITELTAQILESTPALVSEKRTDVSVELAHVIAHCLAKKAEDRFQNVAELAVALLPFAPRDAFASAARTSAVLSRGGTSDPNIRIPSSSFSGEQTSSSGRQISSGGGPSSPVIQSQIHPTRPIAGGTQFPIQRWFFASALLFLLALLAPLAIYFKMRPERLSVLPEPLLSPVSLQERTPALPISASPSIASTAPTPPQSDASMRKQDKKVPPAKPHSTKSTPSLPQGVAPPPQEPDLGF